jgi:hypothetical protein
VIAAVLATGAAAWSGSTPAGATSTSARTQLASALTSSTSHRSARISVVMTQGTSGQGVSVRGQGVVNFGRTAADMTLQLMSVAGGGAEQAAVTVRAVLVGGVTYVNEPSVAQFLPGKTWVSEVMGTPGVTSDIPFNPAYLLKVASARGTHVVALGGSTVMGQAVLGYRVTLPRAATVRSALRQLGIPGADQQDLARFLADGGTRMSLFVNRSHEVVQARLSTMVPTSTGKVGASLVVGLSDYGTAASISAPPASDVATIQQFAAAQHVAPAT